MSGQERLGRVPVVGSVPVFVDRGTPVVAFRPPGGVVLHVGAPEGLLEETPLIVQAPSTSALAHWLVRALAAVVAVDPEADPAPDPDPSIEAARRVLVEDVLGQLAFRAPAGPAQVVFGSEMYASVLRGVERAVELLGGLAPGETVPAPGRPQMRFPLTTEAAEAAAS